MRRPTSDEEDEAYEPRFEPCPKCGAITNGKPGQPGPHQCKSSDGKHGKK